MKRRGFLQSAGYLAAGVGAVAALMPFVKYLLPSAKARALGGAIEVDLSELAPGELRVIEWRGRAILLLRRTPAMLASLAEMTPHLLDSDVTDPDFQPRYVDPVTRSIHPEFLILDGTCTHLGCVPNALPDAGDRGRPVVERRIPSSLPFVRLRLCGPGGAAARTQKPQGSRSIILSAATKSSSAKILLVEVFVAPSTA